MLPDLEDLFDYENICYERKVALALYKLNKYALYWWGRVQFDRIRQGKDKIRSWPTTSTHNIYARMASLKNKNNGITTAET